jgi:hypothetical protein
MPDLPTLSVSQAHFDRIVAAFPGQTMAQKGAAYKAWLTNGLIEFVRQIEARRLHEEMTAETEVALEALEATLPPRAPFPPE